VEFSKVLSAFKAGEQVIPEGWSQGRACFGGLIGALMYSALEELVPDRPPRSVYVSFIGPVAEGPVALKTEVLRAGGSVTQAECRLVQEGHTLAIMLVSFGLARESKIRVAGPQPVAMKPLDKAFPLPYVEGVSPVFLRYFDMRWATEHLPFSRSKEGSFGGWVRFKEELSINRSVLLAMIDAWPPAVIPMYKHPAPSSSLTWTVEFTDEEISDEPWWQFHVDTEQGEGGYCVTQGQLWSKEGKLVALSRQTVTVFT